MKHRFLRLFIFATLLGPCASAVGQEVDSAPIYKLWEAAALQRGQQQYDVAEATLRAIIAEYQEGPNIERRAWCEIIFTRILGGSLADQKAAAREALREYPDLVADTVYIPETVNEMLDAVRRQMFGSLTIREPAQAEVFLDGESVGHLPVFLPYLEVGEYELKVTKESYVDYVEQFTVDPEGRHLFEKIPLKRRKDTKYWLTRAIPAAVAAGSIYYIAQRGDDPSVLSSLPGAPEPPAGK